MKLKPKCGACGASLPEQIFKIRLRFLYRYRAWILISVVLLVWTGFNHFRSTSIAILTGGPARTSPSQAYTALRLPPPTVVPASQSACLKVPINGTVYGYHGSKTKAHALEIHNGSEGPAIVKIRDATTNRLVATLYVSAAAEAIFRTLQDGDYRIQYAIGDSLAGDCISLKDASADEFPGIYSFVTKQTETEITWRVLSFTLYSVPNGNVRPRSMNLAEFNAD